MGRMWVAGILCALLLCGPARGDDAKNGDSGTKETAKTDNSKAVSSDSSAKSDKAEAAKPAAADYREEIEELRELMRQQAQQLSEQQDQLRALTEQLKAAGRAGSSAPAAVSPAPASNKDVAIRPESNASAAAAEMRSDEKSAKPDEAPTSIHIKGITLTPGGFFAAESVYRSHATSSDINTPFTSIPFGGNSLSRESEFNASARQSRISMLAEGKIDHAKFTGYYETDFLSAGATSNNRQSNSYTMRQRQFWGQAALDGGWSFTGGQMWSLVTETKKGVQNRSEANPMTIDPQYNVGFSWARQYGFRVAKTFADDKFTLAFAVEGPQTTFGGRGVANGIFFVNAPGSGGGLFNATDTTGYTVNQSPDFVIKAAADPGWGHYEVFGVISRFRDRVFPCGANVTTTTPCAIDGSVATSAVGAFNDSRGGGGIGFNLRAPVLGKYGDLGIHFLGGDGVGRYGSAQLSDVTARPDGTLAPIRGGQALGTLELHPTPKFDVYLTYGIEYAFRAWYDTSNGTSISSVGYGSPFFNNSGCGTEVPPTGVGAPGAGGTCNGDLRNVQEATIGFWQRFYKGPKGTVQWGLQYSYLVKNTWSGNNNTPSDFGNQPKAIDNMVFTSFRYILP
ncbi:MAG TPA: hypothetical protein VK525_00160 [Candidatus Saccharimonadales bacterium]|nr:hypothetical protein [Candidatus Saccharimonadales bacterium]